MPSARLNVFQKLILRWEAMHPYNGAQVMRLRGPIPQGLSDGWKQTLDGLGLSGFERKGSTYRFSGPTDSSDGQYRVEMAPAGMTLDALLSDHLNRPFTDQSPPLRLVAMPAEGDSHYLAVSYRHFLADSVAIRLVLKALFERVYLLGSGPQRAIALPSCGYWRLFGPSLLGGSLRWSLLRAMVVGTLQVAQMKRVQRVETRTTDHTVAYSSHPMPEGTIDRVLAFARANGLRVNDVLLGAIAQALRDTGPFTATSKRKQLALGSIVDLRPFAPAARSLQDTFGMFLGFTTTFITPDDNTDLRSASMSLARQHAVHREKYSAAASVLRMSAARVAHRLYPSVGSITEWYRKRVPLSAGISNVNLRNDWPQAHHPSVLMEYHRVSPTGPMMPLVFSATTLGTGLHLGLTRRTALVSPEMASAIVDHVRATLAKL